MHRPKSAIAVADRHRTLRNRVCAPQPTRDRRSCSKLPTKDSGASPALRISSRYPVLGAVDTGRECPADLGKAADLYISHRTEVGNWEFFDWRRLEKQVSDRSMRGFSKGPPVASASAALRLVPKHRTLGIVSASHGTLRPDRSPCPSAEVLVSLRPGSYDIDIHGKMSFCSSETRVTSPLAPVSDAV